MDPAALKDRLPQAVKKDKNLHLLTQLLRNMMGAVSAQPNTTAASREIAAQMALMLKAERAVVCGWNQQTNRLVIWGEYKRSLSKQTVASRERRGARLSAFLARALAGREPVHCEASPSLAKELKPLMELPAGTKAILCIPIHSSHEPLGLVIAAGPRPFGQVDMIVGQIFANHAALILDNVHLQDDAQRRSEEIEGLRKASLELSSTLDRTEVITVALRNAHRLLPEVRLARIFLCEGNKQELAGALAVAGADPGDFHDPRPEGWVRDVSCNGESLYLGNLDKGTPGRPVTKRDLAIISMSLQSGDRVLGVIEIVYGPPEFLDEELRIARLLADQTASAMENARLHAQARQAAFTDILTGLPNRRSFDARLEEELRRAARYQRFFSVVMIDLDHFKMINDRFGHNVGDVALQDVARCLRYKVRDTDFLSRYGGDEFVLLLPETHAAEADKLSQKLRAGMGECIVGWSHADPDALSFSYGIAEFPGDGLDVATLMSRADKAMYGDKGRIPVTPRG
ncbi:MAG: diguanylate cyclase [Anaerolineales bacterium]